MDNIKKFEDFLDRMQGLLDSAKKQGHIIVRVEDLENTFPELKESEDEKIRKEIIYHIQNCDDTIDEVTEKRMVAWLEKQGEPTDINPSEFDLRLNKLLKQFETLPKEELASSLSFYLNVVQNDGTYREEKQGEQKPTDKVEPKFRIGDWVVDNAGYIWKIKGILNKFYILEGVEGDESRPTTEWADDTFHLWTIKDAKDGDVLCCESGWTCIFNKLNHNSFGGLLFDSYCFIDRTGWFCDGAEGHTLDERINGRIYPATKEQRDQLEKAMADAGYTFDFDKKELKKIEQKSIWSEEDEKIILSIEQVMNCASLLNIVPEKIDKIKSWLKSLKDRYTWKPSDEQMKALHDLNLTGNISYAGQGQVLIELYNDLEELIK